jgi:transposase
MFALIFWRIFRAGIALWGQVDKMTAMHNETHSRRTQLLKELEQKQDVIAEKDQQLKNQIEQLENKDRQLETKDDIIKQLEQKAQDLELAYSKLWRERFEARSERYIEDPNQLRLDFENRDDAEDAAAGLADAVEEADLIPAHKRRKPRKKRDESFPAHLPRYEMTAEVPEDQKTCPDHGERTLLPESMWDSTETLEFEPPALKVRVTKYPKYSCPNQPQCGIGSPERPTGIVEGDKYDAGIAAEIITGKFSYHLPATGLLRQ